MYFLFFLLFYFSFFSMLLLSFFMMDYSSMVFEFFIPWGDYMDFSISFCFDYLSLMFFSVVSLISCVVFLYSSFYMDINQKHTHLDLLTNKRFLSLLFMFVLSMFFIVFSYSWVSLMLGWDGLGMVSFLLVIYYNDSVSLNSGLVTVFTNRIGDCLFILSFTSMYYVGWLYVEFLSYYTSLFMCFLIMVGSITKSAQVPFSSWLPAAMAAPTPVSSLVHSSTLVTAGVYVLCRFNYLLSDLFFVLSIISIFTMSFAGLCAVMEGDFKKVVAMSTLSQLGFMIYSLSIGLWQLSFLHMVFHAFFKSMLFLSTGSLMHLIMGDQDSRNFGNLSDSFFSKSFFNVSCFSLMGMPFTLGFYSKDTILGLIMYGDLGLLNFLFLVSCCFTVSYSLRLIYMNSFMYPTYFSSVSFSESVIFYIPVIFLFTFTLFSGNFFMFNFLSVGIFSFFDFFIGLVIISLGVMFFCLCSFSYFFTYYLMSVGFFSFLSTSYMSIKMSLMSFSHDFTWGEVMGGKGLMSTLVSLQNNSRLFYDSYFWGIPFILLYLTYVLKL